MVKVKLNNDYSKVVTHKVNNYTYAYKIKISRTNEYTLKNDYSISLRIGTIVKNVEDSIFLRNTLEYVTCGKPYKAEGYIIYQNLIFRADTVTLDRVMKCKVNRNIMISVSDARDLTTRIYRDISSAINKIESSIN